MTAITYNMEEEQCNTSLGLTIGGCGGDHTTTRSPGNDRKPKHQINFDILFSRSMKEEEEREEEDGLDYMAGSRSRKSMREDDAIDRSVGSNNGDERRKKLKLSPEQSSFLEENFKEHSTLNPTRKQDLAERLGLKPRQVEIWFQNRRARTKLKQTEVNCEFLKKCCENLRDENQRLKRELQGLKSTKVWASSHIQLQRAVVMPSICNSCKPADMFSTVGSMKSSTIFNGSSDLENSTRIYKCDSKDSSLTC